MRILLVEDERELARTLKMGLEKKDMHLIGLKQLCKQRNFWKFMNMI